MLDDVCRDVVLHCGDHSQCCDTNEWQYVEIVIIRSGSSSNGCIIGNVAIREHYIYDQSTLHIYKPSLLVNFSC